MSKPALVSHPGTVMVVMIISMAIIAGMVHGPSGSNTITGEVKASVKPQCDDGLDNDKDGFCDFLRKGVRCRDGSKPGDKDCSSRLDTKEAADVFCGDRLCNGLETCSSCSSDCGVCPPKCGDGSCNGNETCSSCSLDCGSCQNSTNTTLTGSAIRSKCGNGRCEKSESCSSCSKDCGACPPVCGNGRCELGESCSSCSPDCGPCQNSSNMTSNMGGMVVRYYYAN
ncbi:MAG: hypothetical protein AABX70_08555 [Nanoarchaeota archaeon]